MTVEFLIGELSKYPKRGEVILFIEERNAGPGGCDEITSGIAYKVIGDGSGAEIGKCEIYGKG